MNTHTVPDPVHRGHAHDVDLEDTFDFLNTDDTENGFPVDKLPTLDDALDLVRRSRRHPRRGRQPRPRPGVERRPADGSAIWPGSTPSDRRSARSPRSIAEQRAPDAGALETDQSGAPRPPGHRARPGPDGCYVDHRHVGDPIDDALARLADPLVMELTAGHPERIKVCASDTCDWIFYDASRTSRRRWCDMATCGNRAKAARHRARERAAAQGGATEAAGTAPEAPAPTPEAPFA